MFTLAECPLNRRFVLRYDTCHELVSDVSADSDWFEIEDLLAGGDDMDVHGISGAGAAAPLGATRATSGIDSSAATDALAPQDEIQISSSARMMDELSRTTAVRQERIEQIQQDIADGKYDTPDLLDKALDKFLDKYGLSD